MSQNQTSISRLKEFAPQLERTSKVGYVWMAVLVLVILWGLYAFVYQTIHGHSVTGMRDHVVWGIYIVNFVFILGISYAGALISGLLHFLRVEWGKPIIRIAKIVTVISILIGPMYILLEIGRLDRIFNVLTYGRLQSPIFWDVIAIITYFIGSVIFLYLALIRDFSLLRDYPELKVDKKRKWIYKKLSLGYKGTEKQKKYLNQCLDVMSALIIPMSIIVSSILAWIFGMTLRPGWHSTIFGPYFVIAGIYTGTAVIVLAIWIFRKVYRLEVHITQKHFKYMGTFLLILAGFYGYFTFSEYLTTWYGNEKWDAELMAKLLDPSEYGTMFLLSSILGIGIPLIVLGLPWLKSINSIAFVSVLIIIALWLKRYLIIIPTLETPLLPVQDIRPEYVKYSATWVEWSIVFGGFAMFCLLLTLASKVAPVVPVATALEQDKMED